MEMTPPHAHMQIDVLSRAGMLPNITVNAPGVHGAGITGMHGIGVSTPSAAAVAQQQPGWSA